MASALCFVLLLAVVASASAQPVSFTHLTNIHVGNIPVSVAVGKFNGDSHPDLAVANQADDAAAILLGAAGGTFTGPTLFGTGLEPSSVAVGEFDGDSHPDLAVANSGLGDVSILLGTGGGSFTGPTNFGVSGAGSVAVGEFNGDSHPDLAVANSPTTVGILLGAGGGSFTGPTDFAVGLDPRSVAVGDFNGDLAPDLAVVNQGSFDVSILLNTTVANRPPTCSGVDASPRVLFSPNHKFVPLTLGGATDLDGDPVTLTITGVTQDEPVSGRGSGNTSPDALGGPAANQVRVRAERSGTGDGRVYRIAFAGSDGEGGSCTGVAKVFVPHSLQARGVDSAPPSYSSFGQ